MEWTSAKDMKPCHFINNSNFPVVLALKQGLLGLMPCVARFNGTEWIEHGKEITVLYWMPIPKIPK